MSANPQKMKHKKQTYQIPTFWVESLVQMVKARRNHDDVPEVMDKVLRYVESQQSENIDYFELHHFIDTLYPTKMIYMPYKTALSWLKELLKAWYVRDKQASKELRSLTSKGDSNDSFRITLK